MISFLYLAIWTAVKKSGFRKTKRQSRIWIKEGERKATDVGSRERSAYIDFLRLCSIVTCLDAGPWTVI